VIAKNEFNILARFEVRNSFDEFFNIVRSDILFPTVYGGFAGVVGGYRFKPVI
jgi:hypothetical protein